MGFLEDSHNALWVYGSGGLYKWTGQRWSNIGDAAGLKDGWATSLLIAKDGAFWVGTHKGLYYRGPRDRQFISLERQGYVARIVQAADGSIWVAHFRGSIDRWIPTIDGPHRSIGGVTTTGVGEIRFDSLGGLWINGLGDGVRHITSESIQKLSSDPPSLNKSVERFSTAEGLSSDYAWPLLIDREGSIWVGTGGGIDRFSRSNFTPARFPSGVHDFSLAAGADNTIWAGSSSTPVMQLKDDAVATFDVPPITFATYRDQKGTVYLGAENGIWRVDAGRPTHIAELPKGLFTVQAMTKDKSDTLWVSLNVDGGLYALSNAHWDKSPIVGTPSAMFTDSLDRVWLGYQDNRLAMIDGSDVTTLGAEQGLMIGEVKAFAQDAGRLWVAGSRGVGYVDGSRLVMVKLGSNEPLQDVTGVVFSASHDLWIHTVAGVYWIRSSSVRDAISDTTLALPYRKFETQDGLPGSSSMAGPSPSVVKSTDGRLWFATSNGVVWLDPDQIISNPVPPPVHIQSILADGKTYPIATVVDLPPRVKDLRIRFSVPSLVMPSRVSAKIHMGGVNKDWSDAGALREVGYSNLSPGRHRFDVIAANEDGVWNTTGDHVLLEIAPAFYQTVLFKALMVLLALVVVWLVVMLRVRQLDYRRRLRFEVQHAERERIARNLHDTLLQDFPALLLKIQSEVATLPEDSSERHVLNETLGKARSLIVESRDHVSSLRSYDVADLSTTIASFAREHASAAGMKLSVSVTGNQRALSEEAYEEASFILREVVLNACRHSGGDRLTIRLDFGPQALCLWVIDNGRGIDPEILEAGAKEGHWGLVGLRERARLLSAQLDVESRSGVGTTIKLVIPRRSAFLPSWRSSPGR
ncbi:sensor histidine kinase [Dyella sp. C11]|uniref:sensor histidine kinase n=1 Tax=Dyella sp. C11 TaxID=2126991 RepID=UPI0018E572A7|nr:sensor histidine kinase [Dyella sp. C11]